MSVNVLSQAITVQTENTSLTAEKVSETNDVTFILTSATGKFLNSSRLRGFDDDEHKYLVPELFIMKIRVAGTYTITVTIKGRTSGKQFSATQTITVTGGGSNSSSSDNSNATSTDNSTASSTSDTSSSDLDNDSTQAYSSQTYIYEGPSEESFNVTIGRNRLVYSGRAGHISSKNDSGDASYSGANFHFSFGDGTEWDGMLAKHTYEYPGRLYCDS